VTDSPTSSLAPDEPEEAEATPEPDDAEEAAPEAEAEAGDEEDEPEASIRELLDRLVRQVSALAFYETRLAAGRNKPAVRRATRDVVTGVVAAVALLAAFVFANVLALRSLEGVFDDWLAALVLAAAWGVLGVVLALVLLARFRRAEGPAESVEAARDRAEQEVRDTIEQLAPLLTREIAMAAVPSAAGVAGGMASGIVDAGDDLLESSEELVESLADDLPGGGVINQVWDVVLLPGRFGVRVATTVLRRGSDTE
jgi:hypothetical protein